jgi:hypothetical protein
VTVWYLFLMLGTAPIPAADKPYSTFDACSIAGLERSAERRANIQTAQSPAIPELRMAGYLCIPREAALQSGAAPR